MDNEIKYEYKEVNVPAGFTDNGRKENLKKLEEKMAKDGWELEKYFNGGLTKTSTATFKRDLEYKETSSSFGEKINVKNIIIGIVVFLIIVSIFNSSDDEEKNQESKVKYHKEFENKTLTEIRKEPIGTLKKVAFSFSEENNISQDYHNTMYDCLAYYTYNKSQELTVGTMLDWCKADYINKDKKAIYYNEEFLLEDFHPWDGSYIPLEKMIKQGMNDESSYEHIKTTYRMEFFGTKRPHMVVNTIFSGKNAFGGVVKQGVSINVDAKTKELYDLKEF